MQREEEKTALSSPVRPAKPANSSSGGGSTSSSRRNATKRNPSALARTQQITPHPPSAASPASASASSSAAAASRSLAATQALTSPRLPASAYAGAEEDYSRTLTGLHELDLRHVIPSIPPRAPGSFNLDAALANLEMELTGTAPVPGGQLAPNAPLPTNGFAPTNFFVSWPPPAHEVSAEQRRLNGGGNYKNNWTSPRDLLVEKTIKTKSSAEFPTTLKIHQQKHQPGLLGLQNGPAPPRYGASAGSQTARSASGNGGADDAEVTGASTSRYSGRLVAEAMSAPRCDTFLAGSRSCAPSVGPGTYEAPRSVANLARASHTIKPSPPKSFDTRGLVSGPAPGSYNVTAVAPKVPVLHFGGTQKTHSRAGTGSGMGAGLNSGGVGTDIGGPAFYDVKEPVFGGEPKSLIFMRSARFPDGSATAATPSSGSYNISGAAVGSIGSSSGRESASFAARGGASGAAMAVAFKRSSGPGVGSYNPSDGMDIGGSSLVGSSNAITVAKPLHKFSTSARFGYQGRPHPLYALVLSDAKKRQHEMVRHFKPNLSDFHAQRKEEILAQAARERTEHMFAVQTQRLALRETHLAQLDRIVHKDFYRQAARERKNAEDFLTFVRRGWMFYIALGARTNVIKDHIRRVRTAKNLRLLTTNAARTIVHYAKKWSIKAHAKKVKRSAAIILRALRRNVTRARLRRKRRAVHILTVTMVNHRNKMRALQCIRAYKSQAILIQRAMRLFLMRKEFALHSLLRSQWDNFETQLCDRYQLQEGEASFEKIRKKGLLVKNLTMAQQRERIIKEIPFDFVDAPLRDKMLAEDYAFRVKVYRAQKYEWLRLRRKHDGLPDLLPWIYKARQHKIRLAQEKEKAAKEAKAIATAATAAAAAAAAAAGEGGAAAGSHGGHGPRATHTPRDGARRSGSAHHHHHPAAAPHHGNQHAAALAAKAAAAAAVAAKAAESAAAATAAASAVANLPILSAAEHDAQAAAAAATTAALAVAGGLPPPPPFDPRSPPFFHRLVTPLRLFSMLTSAQAIQFSARAAELGGAAAGVPTLMDPDVKKKYKTIIGRILKAIQIAETKARKAKEKAIADREKEIAEAQAAAAGAAAVQAVEESVLEPVSKRRSLK